MKIVTDSATDTGLLHDSYTDANITIVPLRVNLGETSYQDGIDIEPDQFYVELEKSDVLPVTSQPSAGEFAKVYRKIAKKDPDILSIHISSGLSGTVNSALAAVKMVPEANVTIVDTKTLSAAAGWQVWVLFGLYGAYYGVAEGISRALVADVAPPQLRGTAYGLYNGAVGLAALPASLIAGLLWQGVGPWPGLGPAAPFYFGSALAVLAAILLWAWNRPSPQSQTR